MAIRFKFRSSVNFDSLDIEGQPSISVRDLTAKIIHHKNLVLQDFDLVFSDAATGQEYRDANFQIPGGSSIIIKRVPAGSAPAAKVAINSVENSGLKDTGLVKTIALLPVTADGSNFDDFGVDLCPEPEVLSYDSVEIDKMDGINIENTNIDLPRFKCSELPILRCQKLETSDLSEAVQEGQTHLKIDGKKLETKLNTKVEQHMRFEEAGNRKFTAVWGTDLTSELKCSLCNNFYKEAVMIPCCQHSFCEKCICLVLGEKQRCPKCFSTKCRVEDLLPNVSLREAIEHFLESQISAGGPDNAFDRYAPDGESGIQARDVSCAVTIHQREPDLPNSSSATGKGSNQMNAESTYESMARNDSSMGDSTFITHFGAADSASKKTKGPWAFASGGNKSFAANDRYRKGGRSCYTCGSQDHLMRDCPAASGDAMFSGAAPGYMPTYWNGAPLHHVRPFQHMYANPGMIPFNSTMVPTPPFAVPSHLPPMYGGVPFHSGIMSMGVASPPIRTSAECLLSHLELSELQDWKKRKNLLSENLLREQSSDEEGDGFNTQYETKRSHFHKSHVEREKGVNNTEDGFARRPHSKQCENHSGDDINSVEERHEKTCIESLAGRDRRSHLPGKSSSEVEDRPNCSSRCSEDRHKCHYRGSRKNDQRKGQGGSDSSRSRNQIKVEKDFKKVERSSAKRHHRHHSHSDSGSEPSFYCDPIKQQKEKDYSHGSQNSKHNKQMMKRDRWQMINGSEDCRDDYHHQKRKRSH